MPNRKAANLPLNLSPEQNDYLLGASATSPDTLQRFAIGSLPFSNSSGNAAINVNIIFSDASLIEIGLEAETQREYQLINTTFLNSVPIVYLYDFTTTYPEAYKLNVLNIGNNPFKIIFDQTQDEIQCNPGEWYFLLGFQGLAWWVKMV